MINFDKYMYVDNFQWANIDFSQWVPGFGGVPKKWDLSNSLWICMGVRESFRGHELIFRGLRTVGFPEIHKIAGTLDTFYNIRLLIISESIYRTYKLVLNFALFLFSIFLSFMI